MLYLLHMPVDSAGPTATAASKFALNVQYTSIAGLALVQNHSRDMANMTALKAGRHRLVADLKVFNAQIVARLNRYAMPHVLVMFYLDRSEKSSGRLLLHVLSAIDDDHVVAGTRPAQ